MLPPVVPICLVSAELEKSLNLFLKPVTQSFTPRLHGFIGVSVSIVSILLVVYTILVFTSYANFQIGSDVFQY
jgi:hypothetical protein